MGIEGSRRRVGARPFCFFYLNWQSLPWLKCNLRIIAILALDMETPNTLGLMQIMGGII